MAQVVVWRTGLQKGVWLVVAVARERGSAGGNVGSCILDAREEGREGGGGE